MSRFILGQYTYRKENTQTNKNIGAALVPPLLPKYKIRRFFYTPVAIGKLVGEKTAASVAF